MITLRRIYEQEKSDEDYKVFVDRLWPRGISKKQAVWDVWMKGIAPSAQLRKWFNHDPSRWSEFKELYEGELRLRQDDLRKIKQLEHEFGSITLIYAAKDPIYNHATVLKEVLGNPKFFT